MSFNDDFLKRQANPNDLSAVVSKQDAAIRQVSRAFVNVRSLDEISQTVKEKLTFIAQEFPSVTTIEWMADVDKQVIAKFLGWYISNNASGAYFIGRGKDSSHKGTVGIVAIPYDDTDYSKALVFDIDGTGEAVLNLRKGTSASKDGKALIIAAEHAVANDLFAILYLDAYTTGTPAAGLGPAFVLRAENSAGVMQTIGYVGAKYIDPTSTSEDAKVVIATIQNGALVERDLAAEIIRGGFSNQALVDATTYYFGVWDGIAPNTSANFRRMYPLQAGRIRTVDIYFTGTNGSNETSSLYLRKNNTTDYLISSAIAFNALPYHEFKTGLDIPVSLGDYFEFKLVAATFATNPAAIYSLCKFQVE